MCTPGLAQGEPGTLGTLRHTECPFFENEWRFPLNGPANVERKGIQGNEEILLDNRV